MVAVWELETGRGVLTLRGLVGQIEKVLLSPDERLLAALAHDSRIAVWDLTTGALVHIFEAPKALWTDNAALAFSPDSRRLAFAGSGMESGQARLWDLATGLELRSSKFPPGLHNILAFHPSKKLLLFQLEARDGKRLLDDSVDFRVNPPVARVRDLLKDPDKHLFEITEFNRGINFPKGL
jgi:WD40 repeat protein